MTTDFMGELQDGIVGKGIFELEYLFYSVGDDKKMSSMYLQYRWGLEVVMLSSTEFSMWVM